MFAAIWVSPLPESKALQIIAPGLLSTLFSAVNVTKSTMSYKAVGKTDKMMEW